MAVAARGRAALDRSIGGNGIGSRITLVRVGKRYRHAPLRARDRDERNAPRRAAIDGAEVRMQARRTAAARDQTVGLRVDRIGRDVAIPRIVGGKHRTRGQRWRRGRRWGWRRGWGWARNAATRQPQRQRESETASHAPKLTQTKPRGCGAGHEATATRSEERRVGKERGLRGGTDY